MKIITQEAHQSGPGPFADQVRNTVREMEMAKPGTIIELENEEVIFVQVGELIFKLIGYAKPLLHERIGPCHTIPGLEIQSGSDQVGELSFEMAIIPSNQGIKIIEVKL